METIVMETDIMNCEQLTKIKLVILTSDIMETAI